MAHLAKLVVISLALGFASSSQEPGDDAELSSAVASIIADNGYLCAEVLDVRALPGDVRFEVTCTEHVGDNKTVRYIMDMRDGTAVKA